MQAIMFVENDENKRVKLTKTLIHNGLTELLAEKTLDKIKISELCERAGVHRSTFYKYYGSQYDVINEIQLLVFDKIQKLISDSKEKNYRDGLVAVLKLLHSGFPKEHISYAHSVIEHDIVKKLAELPVITPLLNQYAGVRFNDWELEYSKQFFVTGALSIIKHWLLHDENRSPSDIADLIINIAEGLMTINK